MCYNGKCMHCIEIETGSLIFAIISVILTGLGVLFTVGMLVYMNVMISESVEAAGPESRFAFAAAITGNVTLGLILCLLLVPFAFTIVLIKGLVQKKAVYVKVYFIYSVITKSLMFFGVTMAIISGKYALEDALILGAVCVFYVLILRMIYMTYKKLEVDEQYERTKLVEQKY